MSSPAASTSAGEGCRSSTARSPLFHGSGRFAQRLLLPVSRDGEEAHQVLMALCALDVASSDRPHLRNRRLMLPG
ncbi:MAG: hypothetical protein IRZ04_05430 [Rhodospirillales bacterium]|nr:hypothetical protein [Rhodospirillales bacterium]